MSLKGHGRPWQCRRPDLVELLDLGRQRRTRLRDNAGAWSGRPVAPVGDRTNLALCTLAERTPSIRLPLLTRIQEAASLDPLLGDMWISSKEARLDEPEAERDEENKAARCHL